MKIEWDDSLAIGVSLIDEQHKQLIEHLNAMSKAVEEHEGEREIVNTLDFLIDYTNYHFTTEEKHMQATKYPELGAHKEKHKEFTSTLDELQRDFNEEGSTKALAEALNTFLFNWLINHIGTVDQEFAGYLGEMGITLPEEAGKQ